MKLKKVICLLLANILAFACLTMGAGAIQAEPEANTFIITRASGQFSTIKATYTPRSASVDLGLMAPDGLFYSLPGQRGSFSETFKVDQRGYYTLAIRNNSDSTISVSGTVTY